MFFRRAVKNKTLVPISRRYSKSADIHIMDGLQNQCRQLENLTLQYRLVVHGYEQGKNKLYPRARVELFQAMNKVIPTKRKIKYMRQRIKSGFLPPPAHSRRFPLISPPSFFSGHNHSPDGFYGQKNPTLPPVILSHPKGPLHPLYSDTV